MTKLEGPKFYPDAEKMFALYRICYPRFHSRGSKSTANHSDNLIPLFWVDQTPEIENVDQSELIH